MSVSSFLPSPGGGKSMPDLVFQRTTLPALERDDDLWIRAADLARALGYPREDKVSRLYRRHADEFTKSMTQVVDIVVEPHFETPRKNLSDGRERIFSMRGCHLVAMLARTPVAREFRHWLLDLIEQRETRLQNRAAQAADVRRAFLAGRMAAMLAHAAPERRKLVERVLLFRAAGHTYAEIASLTRSSVGVVGNIVRRFFCHNAYDVMLDMKALEGELRLGTEASHD